MYVCMYLQLPFRPTPHVETNLQDLQFASRANCKKMIEFEGRDNGHRRSEMGPRPGSATPNGGGRDNNFPGLI